jgi:hypothetical protein
MSDNYTTFKKVAPHSYVGVLCLEGRVIVLRQVRSSRGAAVIDAKVKRDAIIEGNI